MRNWSFRSPTFVAILGVTVTLVLALVVVGVLLLTGGATALTANAALIAAVVALGGVGTTQMVNTALENRRAQEARILEDQRAQQARNLENQRAQEAALQRYFEQMGKLIADPERPLHRSTPGDNLSTVARAQTLSILAGLDDPVRKRILLEFLYESGLLYKPVVSLMGAHLSGANLWGANLKEANLSSANLSGASLREAKLREANLSAATLSGADLSKADLSEANLSRAQLYKANLSGADLSQADLSEARNIPQGQINEAWGDKSTKLPEHVERPKHWEE